ncbi:hypothetical protein FRC18_008938 [Serendipita sp. 400]|nr:hypothetical protein FRC18_008938 [Serendipita sp. 400]
MSWPQSGAAHAHRYPPMFLLMATLLHLKALVLCLEIKISTEISTERPLCGSSLSVSRVPHPITSGLAAGTQAISLEIMSWRSNLRRHHLFSIQMDRNPNIPMVSMSEQHKSLAVQGEVGDSSLPAIKVVHLFFEKQQFAIIQWVKEGT